MFFVVHAHEATQGMPLGCKVCHVALYRLMQCARTTVWAPHSANVLSPTYYFYSWAKIGRASRSGIPGVKATSTWEEVLLEPTYPLPPKKTKTKKVLGV